MAIKMTDVVCDHFPPVMHDGSNYQPHCILFNIVSNVISCCLKQPRGILIFFADGISTHSKVIYLLNFLVPTLLLTLFTFKYQQPRVGSGVVRIDLLHFLADVVQGD